MPIVAVEAGRPRAVDELVLADALQAIRVRARDRTVQLPYKRHGNVQRLLSICDGTHAVSCRLVPFNPAQVFSS